MESENQAPKAVEPKSQLQGLEGFFDTYLREKAPFQLPHAAREWIVKYGPWITLVLLILAAIIIIPLLTLALGLTAATLPYQAMAGARAMNPLGYVSLLVSLASLVMEGIAIPGLMKRKLSGWKFAYYATLLSAIAALINLDILSGLLTLVIGMYILFQIRSYYK